MITGALTFENVSCSLEIFRIATVRTVPTVAVNRRPVPHAMPRPAVIQMALAVVRPLTSPSRSVVFSRPRAFPLPAVVITFRERELTGKGWNSIVSTDRSLAKVTGLREPPLATGPDEERSFSDLRFPDRVYCTLLN